MLLNKKGAFTLAEVLITLGIIGVVAVLTVPNIISNYQKKVYVAQLQKGYAQLQQVFDLAMAEDEVEYLADTELMQSINGNMIQDDDEQSVFISKLGQYIKIQKVCSRNYFSDGCHDITYKGLNGDRISNRGYDLQIFTKGGAIYYLRHSFDKNGWFYSEDECNSTKENGGTLCSLHGFITIDVNGKKGPNIYGRDLFDFLVDKKGQLYAYGSISVEGKHDYWLDFIHINHSCTEGYGAGCTGRIMDSGWVMDY